MFNTEHGWNFSFLTFSIILENTKIQLYSSADENFKGFLTSSSSYSNGAKDLGIIYMLQLLLLKLHARGRATS